MTDTQAQPADAPAFVPVAVRARDDGWTPQVQRRFIEALAATGSVERAAMQVGRSKQGAYQLRNRPDGEGFAAAWAAALATAHAVLVDTLLDRALHGQEVPIFYKGEQVGTRTVHYEGLSLYLLRKLDERFVRAGPHDRIAGRLPAMLDAVEAGEVLTHAEMREAEEEARILERRAAAGCTCPACRVDAKAAARDARAEEEMDDAWQQDLADEDAPEDDEDDDDIHADDDRDDDDDDRPDAASDEAAARLEIARLADALARVAEVDGRASTSAPFTPAYAAALRAAGPTGARAGPAIRSLY